MRRYFTLVASLPALDDFERMRRLPIGRVRLEDRLTMLSPEDQIEARRAEDFLTWQRQPEHRTDEEVLTAYRAVVTETKNAFLRELVVGRLHRRTYQVALRRRHRGDPAPGPDVSWGSERAMITVRRNWNRADFGAGAVHPWIPPMVEHLERGDAVGLERLLMRHSWDALDGFMVRERPLFGFGAVLVFLFQWDIASRWIDYDPARANARFDALLEEAWHGFDWN